MKNLIITILLLGFINVYAQEKSTQPLVAKFIRYYNTEQADSLYALFSDEVKTKIPADQAITIIRQLKAPFGNLLSSEYLESRNALTSYIAVFEKSGPVLYLHFDQNKKLAGFFVNADKRTKSNTLEEGEPISLSTGSAVIKGTLSVPVVSQKVPVVLLIAGSGPTDRDGNSAMMSGKPDYFRKISHALKQKNVAVLRYDKRGVGQSSTTKNEDQTRFDDMVDDAAALIKLLKNDTRFSKIIVAGHSEGSLVGILACQREKADGFISLAGAGFPIATILKSQLKEALYQDDYKNAERIMDTIKAGQPVKQKLNANLSGLFRPTALPYLTSWMKYNPATELQKLRIPVLLVQGTHDTQVNTDNVQQLKDAKPSAGLALIEGMSHILKEAPADKAQNAATYNQNDLQLHPELMPVLEQFIISLP